MRKILLPMLMAGVVSFAGCDDFLSEYSQDKIVAKKVQDLDELLLGDGYLQSSAIASGPSITNPAGFFNIIDDDSNTGRDIDTLSERSTFVGKAWVQSLIGMYGYFGWQQDVGTNYDGTVVSDDAATWDKLYKHINVVNVMLNEIKDLPHATDKDLADFYRVQGEAHFIRAQMYFTLVNLYANMYEESNCETKLGVPLKLTPNVEFKFKRASIKAIYDQIIDDLTKAEDFLTKSPQNSAHYLHRASVEAVDVLFSRVYLYMQKWDLAAEKAQKVMKSQNFYLASLSSLGPNATYLTSENSDVIFSQGSNNLSSTYVFTGRPGDYCVSKNLYDLYDDKDRRKSCFFGTYNNDSLSMVHCDSIMLKGKYERGNSLRAHVSDCFTLRVSEAYLNRMEALAMMGGEHEAEANDLLNKFRAERIDGYVAQNYTGEELVNQIRRSAARSFALRDTAGSTSDAMPFARNILTRRPSFTFTTFATTTDGSIPTRWCSLPTIPLTRLPFRNRSSTSSPTVRCPPIRDISATRWKAKRNNFMISEKRICI